MTATTIATTKTAGYIWAFAIFDFLGIPQLQVSILWVLMVIDFILWITKQRRIEPVKITSHQATIWFIKKLTIFALILSVSLMLKWLELEAWTFLKWTISVLIMAESYSITRNVYAVRTGVILPEYDVISKIIKSLWDAILKMIEKYLSNK